MKRATWAIIAFTAAAILEAGSQVPPSKKGSAQQVTQAATREDIGELWAEVNSLKETLRATASNGRFQVVVLPPRPGAVQDHAVLLDSATGQTWQLVEFEREIFPVWLATTKLDTRARQGSKHRDRLGITVRACVKAIPTTLAPAVPDNLD